MILIDNHIAELVMGYAKIRDAETRLRHEWRGRLFTAYAGRHQKYREAVLARERRLTSLRPQLGAGIGLCVCLLIVGLLLMLVGILIRNAAFQSQLLFLFGFALTLIGTISTGVLTIYWGWQEFLTKPTPPQHPRDAGLFSPLLPRWLKQLKGNLPTELPYDGAVGEFNFVTQLQALDTDSAFILYRLQQRPGDDIDVTVVGRKGVWIFEVKYWSGTVLWRNGEWLHWKNFHGPRGVPQVEEKQVGQFPDRQWQRMADDVVKTLRLKHPGLLLELGSLAPIRGGIVFTHPQATYDIPRDSPFSWNNIGGWINEVQSAPIISSLDECSRFLILDVLLTRHRAVSEDKTTRSMSLVADQLIQQAEAKLSQWVTNN